MIGARIKALPRSWLITVGSVLGLILILGSVFMYRVYDYVQHDNDFCMSCHIMSGPFTRFQRSAHRGLGCKACHRPSIIQRGKMGLRQIFDIPDSIRHHAAVPRETCAECHVRGDPKEWKLIANSVGHRIHLESKDPALRKIECLTCHSAGIHEFAAADKTCGQAGCHEAVPVKLGKMSNLTIHCASCHDYSRPVAQTVKGDSLKQSITPRGNDCFSCHAMRERLGETFPADEPHGGKCGSCHNPHEQSTPAEAVRSCTASGCHERVDTVSPMHRHLGSGVVQNCTLCHKAHRWKANGAACTSCHSVDSLDAGVARNFKRFEAGPARMNVLDAALLPLRLGAALLVQVAPRGSPFRHKPHRAVPCQSCHGSDNGHGVLRIRTAADCAGCHHARTSARPCSACHRTSELRASYPRKVEVTSSVSPTARMKTLSFSHEPHTRVGCRSCHVDAVAMRNVPSCTSCHDGHHTELRSCLACHNAAGSVKEHTREVHLTCTGSGCHQTTVNTTLRTQRNVCLACHSAQRDHEPGGDCASCHMIPKQNAEARAAR